MSEQWTSKEMVYLKALQDVERCLESTSWYHSEGAREELLERMGQIVQTALGNPAYFEERLADNASAHPKDCLCWDCTHRGLPSETKLVLLEPHCQWCQESLFKPSPTCPVKECHR